MAYIWNPVGWAAIAAVGVGVIIGGIIGSAAGIGLDSGLHLFGTDNSTQEGYNVI